MKLTARSASGLNYTGITRLLADQPSYKYSVPRYEFLSLYLSAATSCFGYTPSEPTNSSLFYYGPTILPSDTITDQQRKINAQNDCVGSGAISCLQSLCDSELQVQVFMLDLDRESTANIGRSWTLPALGPNEVYINGVLSDTLKLSIGDTVYIGISMNTFPATWRGVYEYATPDRAYEGDGAESFYDFNEVVIPFTIKAIFEDSASNKYSRESGSSQYFAFISYANFLKSTAPHLNPGIQNLVNQTTYERVQEIMTRDKSILYNEAQTILFSCDNPRYKCYLSSSFSTTAKKLLGWASVLVFTLGYDTVNSNLPVLSDLQSSAILLQFLGLIFSVVVVLLSALAIFLIYSLLMVSVETRTWELGVLRMVGVTRRGIVQLLVACILVA